MKSRKKWLQASRRRQARLMVPRRPHKDQLGKVSCEAGIARKSKMKNRRNAGEKGTRWQHSAMKSKHWEEILERRRMEGSSLKLEVMQMVRELVVHERVTQGKGVKGFKEKKKVIGWSTEEMKNKPNIAVEEDAEEL